MQKYPYFHKCISIFQADQSKNLVSLPLDQLRSFAMRFLGATLFLNGRSQALVPGRPNSFDELFVDFTLSALEGGSRYAVFLHPKLPFRVDGLELQFEFPGSLPRFFSNGFQASSESKLLEPNQTIQSLVPFFRKQFPSGDDLFPQISRAKDTQHSWTYTWIKGSGIFALAGSLNEQTGYTLLMFNPSQRLLTIKKDLSGLQIEHSFPALDVWVGQGEEKDIFDRYARAMGLQKKPETASALGWTSWYRHFSGITEAICRHNLDAVVHSGLPFRYFSIDYGWQTAVGDWLAPNHTFPGGMERLADDIRFEGLKPGLWVAPFVASRQSVLADNHPNWLLRDRKGKLVRAGYNPLWGGWFYALDFYKPGVQEYLSGVFHQILDRWRFELVKLDFLYAVALATPPGKTRGQVMAEAMDFLRRVCGNREIIASGVPLGSAFAKVDYCRSGNEIHLKWENRIFKWLRHRERPSTLASLRSTLGRWQLDKRMFGIDPGAFIIRRELNALNNQQQSTLLMVSALCGSILFTSDDVSLYSPAQIAEVQKALSFSEADLTTVETVGPDVFKIEFLLKEEKYTAWCNLSNKKWKGEVEIGAFEIKY